MLCFTKKYKTKPFYKLLQKPIKLNSLEQTSETQISRKRSPNKNIYVKAFCFVLFGGTQRIGLSAILFLDIWVSVVCFREFSLVSIFCPSFLINNQTDSYSFQRHKLNLQNPNTEIQDSDGFRRIPNSSDWFRRIPTHSKDVKLIYQSKPLQFRLFRRILGGRGWGKLYGGLIIKGRWIDLNPPQEKKKNSTILPPPTHTQLQSLGIPPPPKVEI